DVVLLDIMVPQLNGWEICLRLKQDPALAGIAVIMVTGRVAEGDKVLGFELGADDYVTKPFSPRELVARVRAVARRGKPADGKGKKAHLRHTRRVDAQGVRPWTSTWRGSAANSSRRSSTSPASRPSAAWDTGSET